ncbi:MAG: ATP-binding protein [Planctomycetes bacterium]|nr:ATP-binding protein [Planctomycetota bacterium]
MSATQWIDGARETSEYAAAGMSVLGYVDWDGSDASNERVLMRAPLINRDRIIRDQYVRIEDPLGSRSGFLGRIVAGPFFSHKGASTRSAFATLGRGLSGEIGILAEIELQGEMVDGTTRASKSRPASRATVQALNAGEVADLLGFSGDMVLGAISGQDDIWFRLQSKNKGVLPRNVGIFGTVGSGKSNTSQVVIEEAAANGWAVVVLDVEGEYTAMDAPTTDQALLKNLAQFDRTPAGLKDFHVFHPVSCTSEAEAAEAFTLRLADFESSVIAELLQATIAERNALFDCIEHLESRARNKLSTKESESLGVLLDPSPEAKVPFTLRALKERASERASRSNEFFDYTALATKLMWLVQSGAFDQPNMRSLDPQKMLTPGRVSVIDVSVANDVIKNLATADLLRKMFAYKAAHEDSPPTLLVIEEAHSFISREKAQTMQATMQMLRNVARRGRKRWLSLAFVSQQPGHLPPEIFELCNTRFVHTLRSTHNLDVLMATAGDISKEMWSRCPLLGAGEAIVTSPQLKRPAVVTMRPAMSQRRFTR